MSTARDPRTGRRLWPLGSLAAITATVTLLAALLVGAAALRGMTSWPPPALDQLVFIVIVALALVPVAMLILDLVADRGGRIGIRGFSIDFAAGALAARSFSVPHNIGLPGTPVTDSGSAAMLDVLRRSTATEIVVIDLEDGGAWWETRLLVFLEGSVRLGRPTAVIFTATEAGQPDRFQGWGAPADLLPLLVRADEQYRRIVQTVRAWVRQWELRPPVLPDQPAQAAPWMIGTGPAHEWMVVDTVTGLPNDMAFEQLLQSELGQQIEQKQGHRLVSVTRLHDLFRPVLRTSSIDETWSVERQVDVALSTEDPYLPVTSAGRYVRTMTRAAVLTGIVRSIIPPTA